MGGHQGTHIKDTYAKPKRVGLRVGGGHDGVKMETNVLHNMNNNKKMATFQITSFG